MIRLQLSINTAKKMLKEEDKKLLERIDKIIERTVKDGQEEKNHNKD